MWAPFCWLLCVASHKEAAGHWRLQTQQGPVHVFRPAGYQRHKGGVVVYVHGLYNNVDSAWDEHALDAQFQESNRNAIFIAPEAPVAGNEPVRWANVQALLDTVKKALPTLELERGLLIAMGHSGAYRTIVNWLGDERLDEVVLIDGLYGNEEEFAQWLSAKPSHRMVMTVLTTAKWSAPFVARFPESIRLEYIPKWTWPDDAKHAKLVHIWSHEFGHMEQVTDKQTIPVLLRLTHLARRWEPPTQP